MAQRKTIADYNIRRTASPHPHPPLSFRFLSAVLDTDAAAPHQWPTSECTDAQTLSSNLVFEYTLSAPHRTLVVHEAFLYDEVTDTRLTAMRAWQLIVDAWLVAQQPPPPADQRLRYLAFTNVVEDASLAALVAERDRLVREGLMAAREIEDGRPVVLLPGSAVWHTIPWVRCAERVALSLNLDLPAAQQMWASRALAIFPAPPHLIVEFTSLP